MSGCYKAALHLISLSLLGASWRPVSGLSWGQTDVSYERIQSRLCCVSATSVRSMLTTATLSSRLNPFLSSLILLPFSSGPNSSIPCRRSASPGNADPAKIKECTKHIYITQSIVQSEVHIAQKSTYCTSNSCKHSTEYNWYSTVHVALYST